LSPAVRIVAIASIDVPDRLPATAGAKALAVGRGSRPFTPVRCERQPVLVVDQRGEALGIGLVEHVPTREPGKFREAGPGTGLSHLGQGKIDAVGEDGGQQ